MGNNEIVQTEVSVKKLIRIWWFGMLIDHHLRKGKKFNPKHKTINLYHYEMCLHYYEKAFGKEFQDSKGRLHESRRS